MRHCRSGIPDWGRPELRAEVAPKSGAELVREIQTRLGWVNWVAAVAGAIVVFNSIGFLIPIFLEGSEPAELALRNGPPIIAYILVAGIAISLYCYRHGERALAWVAEEREPSEWEHRQTLRLAVHNVKLAALGWVGAGVIFSVLNAFMHSLEFGIVIAATTWLGGETTCALLYLICERVLRPVTARALAVRVPEGAVAPGMRQRLVMAWLLGTGVPLLGVLVVGVVGVMKSGDVDTEYVGAAVLFLGAVASVVGLLATVFAAKAIAEPVTSVQKGLRRIEGGDLDVRVTVDDGSEVGRLQAGFNRMADGLSERERIRDLFGRQVGEDVARAALRGGTRLGGEEREVGAFFVDLVGSTSMAMAMPPTEVVRVLNRFFRVVVEVVEAEGGLVNKFEGDAALCVFGAPVGRDDPAGDALRAARRLAARLARDVPEVDYGIGISAGVAVAGNVGAEHRFEYTVIGDPVNEAARLAELAKQRPERVLTSQAALARAGATEGDAWRVTESAVLRGRNAPTDVAYPRS